MRGASAGRAGRRNACSFNRRVSGWGLLLALGALTLGGLAPAGGAQSRMANDSTTVTFASAADVAGALTAARASAPQPLITRRLIQAAPYAMDLEYRRALPQRALVLEGRALMVYVLSGSATLVTGGRLTNERRVDATTREGGGVEGGRPRSIGVGDQFFVPENTPYWFSTVDDAVALLSLRVPRPVRPCCVYLGQMAWVPGGTPADTTFISGARVDELLARVTRERQDNQALASAPIVQLLPYTSHIEYRQMGPEATRVLWHGSEAELFIVMNGSATMLTGGRIVNEQPTTLDNRSGTGAEGASSRRLEKGDIVFVPEKTPHGFSAFHPSIVLRSLHVPRGADF